MARKRSNINALSRSLGDSSAPIYALDSQRRIIYCNAALTAWLGVEPRRLMGAVCNYHSGGGGERFDPSLLCPPPEAFAGQVQQADLAWVGPDGRTVARRARFIPLPGPEGKALGVLAIVDDQPADTVRGEQPAAEEPTRLHAELSRLLSEIGAGHSLDPLVGAHPAIVRARDVIRLAATSDFRTLVVGPPGSGREHIARAVHYSSAEQEPAPLAPLACNLLDGELLEQTVSSFIASCAELQLEQPPALLLLEIDQLPADSQRALAGLLSIGELSLRTVATARRRLIDLAAEDRFREDLAFSLSTLEIAIPPLSERRTDIPLLIQFFLEKRNAQGGKQLAGCDSEALELLTSYAWPGNVDELAELVGAAWADAEGPLVRAADLPARLQFASQASMRPAAGQDALDLDAFLADVEKELLQRAMRRAKGKKARAARLLGISAARMIRRLQHFGLDPER